MLKLMGMLCTEVPKVMPKRRVLSGRLLKDAATKVEAQVAHKLNGKEIGIT